MIVGAELGGESMQETAPPSFSEILGMFSSMPPAQLIFLVLFAGTALIGGNVVFAMHERRVGRSESGLRRLFNPTKDFNASERRAVRLVYVASFVFGVATIYLGRP